MEQRILEISKKQSDIVSKINARKREFRLSEGKSFSSREAYEQPPIFIDDRPKFEDRYSTPNRQQPISGVRLESTAPVKGASGTGLVQYQSELSQQLLQEQSLNDQLRRQLESKSSDYEKLNAFTEHLKSDVDNLNRQLMIKQPKGGALPPSYFGEGSQGSLRA